MHKQFLAFDKTLIIMYNITILTRGIIRLKGAVIFLYSKGNLYPYTIKAAPVSGVAYLFF